MDFYSFQIRIKLHIKSMIKFLLKISKDIGFEYQIIVGIDVGTEEEKKKVFS